MDPFLCKVHDDQSGDKQFFFDMDSLSEEYHILRRINIPVVDTLFCYFLPGNKLVESIGDISTEQECYALCFNMSEEAKQPLTPEDFSRIREIYKKQIEDMYAVLMKIYKEVNIDEQYYDFEAF